MFHITFIGGPLGGTVEERHFAPKDLIFRSPRGNGTYVRTSMDTKDRQAVMEWQASSGHPCPSCAGKEKDGRRS